MSQEEVFPHAIQQMVDTNDFHGLHETKLRVQEIFNQALRDKAFLIGGMQAFNSVQTELDCVHKALNLVSKRIQQSQSA